MVHYEENEEGLHVHVPTKTVVTVLLALLTAVVSAIGYPVLSMVTTARHDPFTGTQGAALEARIQNLEDQVQHHARNAEEWKYRIIAVEEKIKK